MVKNAFSIDLESFVHREFNLKKRKRKDNWFTPKATHYLLKLLDRYKTKATFFIVGEVYNMYPSLIEDIQSEGHEIGFHSHKHVFLKSKEDLQKELLLSKTFLSKFKPIGFRAPRMQIQIDQFDILKKFNFKYDSSIYNEYRKIEISGVREIPVSIAPYPFLGNKSLRFPQDFKTTLAIKGIPYGSGLLMTILGKNIKYFIDQTNKKGLPSVLFIHPWQLMPYESFFSSSYFYNLPKIVYKKSIKETLEFLLSTYQFVPLKNLL